MEQEEKNGFSPEESGEDFKKLLDKDESAPRKAPLPFRIAAWISAVAVFFALGYGGTSLVLKYLDQKGVTAEKSVVADTGRAEELLSESDGVTEGSRGIHKARVRLYVLEGGDLQGMTVEFVPGLLEEDAQRALTRLFHQLKVKGALKDEVQVLHFFRTGDLAYLDLNDSFLRSLNDLPKTQGVLMLTGVVRTITENFAPVTKVRFLINGREVTERGAVDLSVAWQLAPRS